MPGRVYNYLLEIAQDQYGFVTAADAKAAGFDGLRLQDFVRRGAATRIAYGLYRLNAVPVTPLDQYMEAVLWPYGQRGVLCHETALEIHDLCDVNPVKVHLTLPEQYRIRREVPDLYGIYHRDLDRPDITFHEAIPVVTPYRAILDVIETHLRGDLVEQAIENARRRGLLRKDELAELESARTDAHVRAKR